MKKGLLFFAFAFVCGACCQKYRHSYEPSVTGDTKTNFKYRIAEIEHHVMRGAEREEFDPDVSWYKSWLEEMQNEQPQTFDKDGIPIKIILTDHLNPVKSDPTAALFIFSLGIIPLWNQWEDKITVDVSIINGASNAESVDIKRDFCETFSSVGLSYLLPVGDDKNMRFTDKGADFLELFKSQRSKQQCWRNAYGYAIAAALAKMECQGKMMLRSVVPELRPRTIGEQLDDLKKAGVISEEEFGSELDKMNDVAKVDRGACVEYEVQAGDTMKAIATKHGMTLSELKELNNLKSDRLRVGQKLKVRK